MSIRVAAMFVALVVAVPTQPAQANWFTRVLKEAGEAAEHGGRRVHLPDGFGALDDAARHVASLPAAGKGAALAAHVTPEGHWKFANTSGEVFTAANADEMKRAVPTLLPETAGEAKLSLYLSEETVFERRALLKDLPSEAELHLVADATSYRLARTTSIGAEQLHASVRPNLVVEIGERRLFEEAVFQLRRPLNRSNMRLLALEAGGPKRLSSVPGFDPATKAALVDTVDPAHAQGAFASLRGQSVVVTGRVEAGVLHAGDSQVALDALTRAAETNDVNLIVLQSQATRQPGGRNWLWQKVEVSGFDDAVKRATFADFLNALGASRGAFAVTAAPAGGGRITLKALPTGGAATPLSGQFGGWWDEAVAHVTGEVITKAVEANVRDKATQSEQDLRIVPWLPSMVPIAYLGALVLGLFSTPVVRGWWQHVWPREARAEYRGGAGYWAARMARGLAYVLLFNPLAALPALPVTIARTLWGYLMLPVRFFRWVSGRGPARAA